MANSPNHRRITKRQRTPKRKILCLESKTYRRSSMKKLLLITLCGLCFVGCTSKFSIFSHREKHDRDDKSEVGNGNPSYHVPHGVDEFRQKIQKMSLHKPKKSKKLKGFE